MFFVLFFVYLFLFSLSFVCLCVFTCSSVKYEVHGIIRRSSSFNTGRIDHLYRDLHENPSLILHYGDLSDSTNISSIMNRVKVRAV